MLCSHCNRYIKVSDISQQRGKGFHTQVQCPHCSAWLGRSATLAKLKLLGFYLSVFTAGYCYFDITVRYFLLPVMIFSLMLLFVSHFMDHVITLEAPAKVDDSDQRQKYR